MSKREELPLPVACARYVAARLAQLEYRTFNDGDSVRLVNAVRKAYDALRQSIARHDAITQPTPRRRPV